MSKRYDHETLKKLNSDVEFQRMISEDEELSRLFSAPKRERDDRILELALALGGCAEIREIQIPAPTPGVVMILAVIGSPLVMPKAGIPNLLDVDIAAYIMVMGREALDGVASYSDIETMAAGYCDQVNVPRVELWNLMQDMISESVRGLERIPSNGTRNSEPVKFSLGWYAEITAGIAEAAQVSAEYAGWSMPLAIGVHYLVALHRKNGGKTYDASPADQVMQRLNNLMDERIKEMGY